MKNDRAKDIAYSIVKAGLGAVPFAGGVFSAIAGAWSEGEQEKVNRFFEHWVHMLQDELKEKDAVALEKFRQLYNSIKKEVVPIESRVIAMKGGVLNCITWN